MPGAELDGVYYLRTLADCDVLRERLDAGGKVVVVGAGWIGSEFAASARQRGLEVTVIDPLALPNGRIFGPEIGAFYRDVHAQHGVELLLGEGVEAFEGDGAVTRVRTGDGQIVDCDFVVVGVGIAPRTELAGDAGLDVDNGILVDEKLQTSVPNVFAAGDVANAWHPFYERHIRVEHWANALNQGPAAARAMLGEHGQLRPDPVLLLRPVRRRHGVLGLRDGVGRGRVPRRPRGRRVHRVLAGRRSAWSAGMNVNVWDVNEHVQALIRSRRPVDVAALTDPDTPLDSLLGPSTA